MRMQWVPMLVESLRKQPFLMPHYIEKLLKFFGAVLAEKFAKQPKKPMFSHFFLLCKPGNSLIGFFHTMVNFRDTNREYHRSGNYQSFSISFSAQDRQSRSSY